MIDNQEGVAKHLGNLEKVYERVFDMLFLCIFVTKRRFMEGLWTCFDITIYDGLKEGLWTRVIFFI